MECLGHLMRRLIFFDIENEYFRSNNLILPTVVVPVDPKSLGPMPASNLRYASHNLFKSTVMSASP